MPPHVIGRDDPKAAGKRIAPFSQQGIWNASPPERSTTGFRQFHETISAQAPLQEKRTSYKSQSRRQGMKRLAVLLLVLGMNQAYAGTGKLPVSNTAKWKEECGSCHVAYPPQLLSSDSWQRLMGSLNRHFGANAVLDSKDNKMILGFLERNAGSDGLYSSASMRISETPWFKREHHGISPKEWTQPDVKSPSNCSACHGRVVLGD
jgi:hypothetical protein